MSANFKILHKGLALVLIPLAINTVWIAMLNDALSRSQELIDQERHQSRLLYHLNSAIVEYGTVVGSAMNFLAMQREYSRTRAKYHLAILKEHLNQLEQIAGNNIEDKGLVAGMRTGIDKHFKIIEDYKLPDTPGGPIQEIGMVKSFRDFGLDAGVRNQYMMSIIDKKEKQMEQMRRDHDELSRRVRFTVYAGLVVNFLMALLLLFLFIQNITGRLAMLVENADRLPKNLPLSRTVGGSDELSELDAVLHQAGRQLTEATEFRRSLMQMMAHDLRSPLSSSLVALELLNRSDEENLSASGQKQIASISKSLNRLLGLISDLLLMESLETGKMEIEKSPTKVRAAIEAAFESVASLAGSRRIKMTNNGVDDYAVFDKDRILQVLINLLSNAIKFSPPGTEIVVSAARQRIPGKDEVMKFTVTDQGSGLKRSEMLHLFQKHFQTEDGKKAGGSGLGLAICKLIVEAHEGEIGVESVAGKGSTFWFVLPYEKGDDNVEDPD